MFKVGDKVRAFGYDGVVTSVISKDLYPIRVMLNQYYTSFTEDGKSQCWHKEPSLVLIERPKQLIKKYLWAFIDWDGVWQISGAFYKDEIEVINCLGIKNPKRIDSVFIEVEE